jgi:hypothetical protein
MPKIGHSAYSVEDNVMDFTAAPLVTNATFKAYEKETGKLELRLYFQTTRDIIAVLNSIQANAESDADLRQRLADFCKERTDFLVRNGFEILHYNPYVNSPYREAPVQATYSIVPSMQYPYINVAPQDKASDENHLRP